MNHEEEHIDIRNKLLKLPKVKARDGFENELLRRINLIEPEAAPAKQREGIFSVLFGRKAMVWTVPAMSLTVVAIVVFGWYYIFNGKLPETRKQDSQVVTQNSEGTTPPPPTSTTKKNEDIAGREITNDLETGRDSKLNDRTKMKTGVDESYFESAPKIDKNKSVEEGRIEVDTRKVKEEIKQRSVPEDRKDAERYKSEDIKTETIKENKKKSADVEKKVVSPMLKETDKVSKGDFEESEKTTGKEQAKDSTRVSKKNKANNEKELTKDVLESLSRKIKDNK